MVKIGDHFEQIGTAFSDKIEHKLKLKMDGLREAYISFTLHSHVHAKRIIKWTNYVVPKCDQTW